MARRTILCVVGSLALFEVAWGQTQFDPFTPAPYALDNVQGEIVNLETQLIKPILVTQNEQFVVVANEADDRVVVLNPTLSAIVAEIVVGQGVCALAERPFQGKVAQANPPGEPQPGPVGEIWAVVRHQSCVVVINPITWRITHVLRPPIDPSGVGLRDADAPGGIVFNASGSKAYVAAGTTDSLTVYDATAKTWLRSVALRDTHNQMTPSMNEPFAVARSGNSVFVISHLSGNQTAVQRIAGGPVDIIGDLGPLAGFSLPDFDIMIVDTSSDTVIGHRSDIGTVLFGIAVHPINGKLLVSNFDSRNGAFIGEGAFPQGKVVFNRLTYLDPATTTPSPVTLEFPSATIGMPTDITVDGFGRVFVAGYASSNIGVLDGSGAFIGVIPTDAGPRGLAFAPDHKRLYSMNRAAGTVWCFDVSQSGSLPTTPLFTRSLTDPTFDRVKLGRQKFLDLSHSGGGTTFCGSCHPDLRKDGVAWELSKYFDKGDGFTYANPPTAWKDRKGPMVTQDNRSLPDVPPYHWRGEQLDLEAFNDAFVGLLKGSKLLDPDFALFKDYTFSAVYPPNPFQGMNRVYSATAQNGIVDFSTLSSDPRTCRTCHELPTGSDCGITIAFPLQNSPLVVKSTQLRGMWTKSSDLANADDNNPPTIPPPALSVPMLPMTGFGFSHSGNVDSFSEFVNVFFPPFSQQQKDETIQFLDEFDSGLAPATMYSEFLNAGTASNNRIGTYMIDQANAGNCDLVARGRIRPSGVWKTVGLLFDSTTQLFKPDTTSLGTFALATLQSLATNNNAELLFMGVPKWSGERIGIDRDRDGIFDGDEGVIGTSPTNPDTDGDGLWDSYDPQPLNSGTHALPTGAPVASNIQVAFTTTNSVKITYETDTFSPTRVQWGLTTSYGQFTGDPFPLPVFGANNTNLWKRRHTAFLRLLDDAQTYHFRIVTEGQNGVTGNGGDNTAIALNDVFPQNLRVGSITLPTPVRTGSTVTYTAIVHIVDNTGGNGFPATVRGRWTPYTGLNFTGPNSQTQATDSAGIATFTFVTTNQAAGDETTFDIPMLDGTTPGVASNATPPRRFEWPEGPSAVTVTAP